MATKYTKGAKRRAKRGRKDAPDGLGLAEVPKRQPNGQLRDRADSPGDPRKTALQARVRQFGGQDTQKGRKAVSDDFCGSQIGFVMKAKCSDIEARALWQTFRAWCMAEDQYRRRYIGQSEHAKGTAIVMVADEMQTDTSLTVDLRDADQRDRDAVRSWMRWQGYLGRLSRDHHRAMHDARLERVELWRDHMPTKRGLVALNALRALHDVVRA